MSQYGEKMLIKKRKLPRPADAICFSTSNSRVTGFPGSTPESCDTVLLTEEYNLLITSIFVGFFVGKLG